MFALVLVLLLAGAAACAAAGGRSPLSAAFPAGGLHPAAAAATHSGSGGDLRDPDGDPVAEVSLFLVLDFFTIVTLPLQGGPVRPSMLLLSVVTDHNRRLTISQEHSQNSTCCKHASFILLNLF